jgi:hypothetical protein
MINTHSKNVFAKILATENIIVQHSGTASTASFDLHTRVLTLPVWNNMTDSLYDMLIGHEVSHAINTPSMTPAIFKDYIAKIANGGNQNLAQMVMNVVEDARIERMIKDSYPGLRRDFYHGYKSILEMDLFGLADRKINDLPFIDRLNLFTKVGNIIHEEIEFSTIEQKFVDEVQSTFTFDDVIDLSRRIFEFIQLEHELQSQEDQQTVMVADSTGSGGEPSEGDQPFDGVMDIFDSIPSNGVGSGGNPVSDLGAQSGSNANGENTKSIQETLEENLKKMASNSDRMSSTTHTIPTPKLDRIVVDYKDFYPFLRTVAIQENGREKYEEFVQAFQPFVANIIQRSKRTVSLMVQQFERKKAADESRRSRVNKTGLINLDRLHQYKFSEDIFLSRTVFRDAKNHGFVIYLDWSGSMSTCLHDTIMQTLQIALFCKAAKIPFELYAISSMRLADQIKNSNYKEGDEYSYATEQFTNNSTDVELNCLSLPNLLSSRMNKAEFDEAMRFIALAAVRSIPWNRRKNMVLPSQLICTPWPFMLGGTPLNAAIICANDMVKEFKERNKIQIVNTVFMTDGESDSIHNIAKGSCLQDRRSGFMYRLSDPYGDVTKALIELHKFVTGANTVRFHLDMIRTITHGNSIMFKGSSAEELAKCQKCFDNENFCVAHNSLGFDELYLVRSDTAVDGMVDDNVLLDNKKKTFTGLKNAFVKLNQNKITSRVLLSRFIEIISR